MDGLTVSSSSELLKTGKTTSQIKENKFKSEVAGPSKSFADTLSDAIQDVNRLQVEADTKMQKLSTGESKNIPEVLIATEKADIALKLMVQVRNKMIEAYREIMKMQV